MLQNRPICQLTPDLSEAVAQDIHEVYRRAMRGKEHIKDPSTAPWDDLPQYLKDSCKQQAEHIVEKLCSIGFTILKVTDRDIELVAFTDDEVEIMAEMEHERWIGDRLLGGWTLGTERNANNRTTPYLVPYSELPDSVKELDRQMVRKIPEFLAKVGLEVSR